MLDMGRLHTAADVDCRRLHLYAGYGQVIVGDASPGATRRYARYRGPAAKIKDK